MSLDPATQDALAAAYLHVFNPDFPEGKRVFDDIMDAAGLLDAGSPEDSPTGIAWQAGRRSLAVFILNRMSWSPGELALLRRRMAVANLHGLQDAVTHPPSAAETI